MSPGEYLKQLMSKFADDALHVTRKLEKDLQEIKTKEAQIEAQLHAARLRDERLRRYQPEIGGTLQCPSCWAHAETNSSLVQTSDGTTKEGHFRCESCGRVITIPFRTTMPLSRS